MLPHLKELLYLRDKWITYVNSLLLLVIYEEGIDFDNLFLFDVICDELFAFNLKRNKLEMGV